MYKTDYKERSAKNCCTVFKIFTHTYTKYLYKKIHTKEFHKMCMYIASDNSIIENCLYGPYFFSRNSYGFMKCCNWFYRTLTSYENWII